MQIEQLPKRLRASEYEPFAAVLIAAYASGMSYRKIGEVLDVPHYCIGHAMRRFGNKGRPLGPTPRRGPANYKWKGEAATYAAKHMRVRQAKGKASGCSRCGLSAPERRYDWANLTGNYDDVNDFASMCRPCHRRYDYQRAREGYVNTERLKDRSSISPSTAYTGGIHVR